MTENKSCGLDSVVRILQEANQILILAHMSPDGDTIGSSFALKHALGQLGKKAAVKCADDFPDKYKYIYGQNNVFDFAPDLIVASDIATEQLLGEELLKYSGQIDLCIDHHPSNTHYAKNYFVQPEAAATCEIMAAVINQLGVNITKIIAESIYTGMATDTGCFRYSNVTPKTLRCAADMIEYGAGAAEINKRLFETVTRQRMELEKLVMQTLKFYHDGKIAVLRETLEILQKSGAEESETEGVASIPSRIEGVLVGITLKEQKEDGCKISVRTSSGVNASQICAALGGGGHNAAAGCRFKGSMEDAENAILLSAQKGLKQAGIL